MGKGGGEGGQKGEEVGVSTAEGGEEGEELEEVGCCVHCYRCEGDAVFCKGREVFLRDYLELCRRDATHSDSVKTRDI